MTDNEKVFSESFLFSGDSLKLADNVYVKHPTINEIEHFSDDENGFNNYYDMINILMCDPYDYMVMLDDAGIDYDDVDNFDVFCILWNSCFEKYEKNKDLCDLLKVHPIDYIKKALTFFLGKHNFNMSLMSFQTKDGIIKDKVLVDSDLIHKDEYGKDICDYVITRDMFKKLSNFIYEINGVDKTERMNVKRKSSKKILIQQKREELKHHQNKKPKNEYGDYIGKVMEALCFCGNGGITLFNIKDIHIFQLITGFSKFIKKDSVNHLMNGQYDLSKISKKELDWFN